MKTFGEFLKKLRTERHFTQTQVAAKLGITRQAYSYYERSISMPDINILLQLAAFYGIPLEIFLNYCAGDEQPPEAFHPADQRYEQALYPEFLSFYSQKDNMKKYHHLNHLEKELLFLFQKLSESEQKELLLWTYFKSTICPGNAHCHPDY